MIAAETGETPNAIYALGLRSHHDGIDLSQQYFMTFKQDEVRVVLLFDSSCQILDGRDMLAFIQLECIRVLAPLAIRCVAMWLGESFLAKTASDDSAPMKNGCAFVHLQ